MPRGDVGLESGRANLDERIDTRSRDAVDHYSAVAISPLAFDGSKDGIDPRGRRESHTSRGACLFDPTRYHPRAYPKPILSSYTRVCFNQPTPQVVNHDEKYTGASYDLKLDLCYWDSSPMATCRCTQVVETEPTRKGGRGDQASWGIHLLNGKLESSHTEESRIGSLPTHAHMMR